MTQELGVLVIVGGAVAYLVWKMTRGGRPAPKKRGPDVAVDRLVRKRRSK